MIELRYVFKIRVIEKENERINLMVYIGNFFGQFDRCGISSVKKFTHS